MGRTYDGVLWSERIGDRRRLVKSAHEAWTDWVLGRTSPTAFGTLTFRPSGSRGISDKSAMWAAKMFVRAVRRHFGPGVRLAVTLEHHKDGRPHLHLVGNLPELTELNKAALHKLWRQSHRLAGFTRWRKVQEGRTAARYATKYVVKEGGDFLLESEVRNGGG